MVLTLFLAPVLAQDANIPAAINYQGKLTDSAGNALASGQYLVEFRIWEQPTGDNPADYVWGRSFPLYVVSGGLFNILLSNDGGQLTWPNATGQVPSVLEAFEEPNRYLGLTVRQVPGGPVLTTATEISPRQRLVSAPYAIHAQQASSATYATVATNATKLANYTTNDFLMVNKASQTLTGNLTVNGKLGIGTTAPDRPLTVQASGTGNSQWLSLKDSAGNTKWHLTHEYGGVNFAESGKADGRLFLQTNGNVGIGTMLPASKLDVKGTIKSTGLTADGSVMVNSGTVSLNAPTTVNNKLQASYLDVVHALTIYNVVPIQIRRYTLPDIPLTTRDPALYATTYSNTEWSAVIAGHHFYADIHESQNDRFLEVRMRKSGTVWAIAFDVAHQDVAVTRIEVDVMFIRRELTDDYRN
ncbi:MAG: hypothetical protein JXQ71_18105 [Verrucomicrobia bacterium]|nr:hypothetical protein [Verrucomicrobiota bacterium]